jgi:hypothetical protein
MTNKERAELLHKKYTKDYLRFVVSGYVKQGYPEEKNLNNFTNETNRTRQKRN